MNLVFQGKKIEELVSTTLFEKTVPQSRGLSAELQALLIATNTSELRNAYKAIGIMKVIKNAGRFGEDPNDPMTKLLLEDVYLDIQKIVMSEDFIAMPVINNASFQTWCEWYIEASSGYLSAIGVNKRPRKADIADLLGVSSSRISEWKSTIPLYIQRSIEHLACRKIWEVIS